MCAMFHEPGEDFQYVCRYDRDFMHCSRCLADPLRVAEGIMRGGVHQVTETLRILVDVNSKHENGSRIAIDGFPFDNTLSMYYAVCDNMLSCFTLVDYARVYCESDLLSACRVLLEMGVPVFQNEKYYRNYLIGPIGLVALIARDTTVEAAIYSYSSLYISGHLDPSIFDKQIVILQCPSNDDLTISIDALLEHRNLERSIARLREVRALWNEKGLDKIF